MNNYPVKIIQNSNTSLISARFAHFSVVRLGFPQSEITIVTLKKEDEFETWNERLCEVVLLTLQYVTSRNICTFSCWEFSCWSMPKTTH